jgi:hypothetical protein
MINDSKLRYKEKILALLYRQLPCRAKIPIILSCKYFDLVF